MKKIFLIRHAESESNIGGIFEHNRLVKLSETGKQQAKDLVEVLEKPDRVIVSKFLRTQETAEPLLLKHKSIETHLWLDTHEFDYLDRKQFIDKSKEEFEKYAKQFWINEDPFVRYLEDKETFQEFADRVHFVIQKMNLLSGTNYIFTHGLFIMMFQTLVKFYSYKEYELASKEENFYKILMKKFNDVFHSGEITQLKNTEVLNVTELVQEYCK